VTQSRLGLLFNAMVKVPMQLAILSLGVLVFVFYLFAAPPLWFDPAAVTRLGTSAHAAEYIGIEARHSAATAERREHLGTWLDARKAGNRAEESKAAEVLRADQKTIAGLRTETAALLKAEDPKLPTSDTNYVFLSFVLTHLPVGIIGLVFACIFAASMNSTSAELNALTSTTVVDVVQRIGPKPAARSPRRDLWLSRGVTVAWAAFAVLFAQWASRLGSLIEAVNILGSLFYGTILGIFLTAFYLKRVGGTAVFIGALVAEAAVIACFKLTAISFLWYNLIGCALVVLAALGVEAVRGGRARPLAT
jgi:hypothetical protein